MSLRVLARPAFSSGPRNPYTSLIYEQVQRAGHRVTEFSLLRALRETWDVIHVHWPESVFNHTLVEAVPTTEALLLALRVARRRGAKVLWTVHNLHAHEKRHVRAESRFRQRFFRELDGIVGLHPSGIAAARERYPQLGALPAWVVPHPHYRGQYPDRASQQEARAALALSHARPVLLCVGRVFEYKNFESVLRVVRASDRPWDVVVAGQPRDARVRTALEQAAGSDARLHLHLRFIPPDELQNFMRAATLVVQPYREILNSGTALLALSFDRPVLLPQRGSARDLQNLVPSPWVQTFDGEISITTLSDALRACESLPERTQGEHLSSLSRECAGRAQVRALEELVAGTWPQEQPTHGTPETDGPLQAGRNSAT